MCICVCVSKTGKSQADVEKAKEHINHIMGQTPLPAFLYSEMVLTMHTHSQKHTHIHTHLTV